MHQQIEKHLINPCHIFWESVSVNRFNDQIRTNFWFLYEAMGPSFFTHLLTSQQTLANTSLHTTSHHIYHIILPHHDHSFVHETLTFLNFIPQFLLPFMIQKKILFVCKLIVFFFCQLFFLHGHYCWLWNLKKDLIRLSVISSLTNYFPNK